MNYAFIDSQNLNLSIKSMGWSLDFARFRVYLADKYQVHKAFRKLMKHIVFMNDLRGKLEHK